MTWIKFHEELCKGSKRDLSRATRFVYLEICMEARRCMDVREGGAAWVPISSKGTLAQAVRDLIGGNAMEIRHAVKALLAGSSPMLAEVQPEASPEPGQRYLVVRSFAAWNQVDDSSKRVKKFREQKREVTKHVTCYTADGNAPVTPSEKRREEERRGDGEEEGAREGPGVAPDPTPATEPAPAGGALASLPVPPTGSSLLDIAERCAAEGHPFASKMLAKLNALATLTTGERTTLRTIDDELFGSVAPEARGLHVAFGNAYAVGMREATGAPFALGRGSRQDLLAMAEHHARGPDGVELVGDAAIHWFREVAKEYWSATRTEARFQSGFSVAACLRWLNAGRPTVRRPANHHRIQRDTTGDYTEENIRQENLVGLRDLASKEPEGYL